MSKLTQIETALMALDPAAFHRLCDSYLYKLGYTNIQRIGLVLGAEKAVTGTPDTFLPRPDGTYDYVEVTTEQKGLAAKFKGDLAKCFDETKTGIPVERIHEVMLCHNSKLTTEDDFALGEQCRRHNTLLSIFGLTRIAHDLYQKYPDLAKEFLGIQIDTGQVLSIADFVSEYGKNRFATPLDTAFQFREDELQRVKTTLEEKDLVFVTGKAGSGKTRLALEVCRQYREDHPDAQVHCILNKGIDVFEDVRSNFSAPGHYLILVDDTNRITKFEYALQLLHDRRPDQTIKIIATVRDYALHAAQKAALQFSDSELIELNLFNDDQIKELVTRGFGINNHFYLDRIAEIAKGNPRLAIMAARVAKRENRLDSIADVSSLYDEYFASIKDDLKELGDPNLILVAGIISFFRSIDRSNKELMGKIEAAFELPADTFFAAAKRLHELEVVDMLEREIVRISDQVLSNYLFYLAVFRERALDFAVLLEEFFPSFRYRMTDAMYPVLNAFDSPTITTALRPHIDRAWTIFQQRGDEAALLYLIDVFWFVKQTDTLVYLRDSIRNLEPIPASSGETRFKVSTSVPETPSVLGILDNFRYTDEASTKAALSLICDHLEKRPAEVSLVLKMLTERYGMTHHSYLNGFVVEQLVADELWQRSREGQDEFFSRLFLAVVESLLHTHFQTTEPKSRLSISIIKFDVTASIELLEFRKSLWQRVFSLRTLPNLQDDVLELFEKHSGSGYLVANPEIVNSDARLVLSFFQSALDPTVYRHCLLVHNYLDMLQRMGVEYDANLRTQFTNDTYALSNLLFIDRREQRELGWREYEQLRRDRLCEYTADYDTAAFALFFERCAEIVRTSDGQQFQYQVQQSAVFALLNLADRNPNLFTTVVTNYIANGNVLELFSGPVIEKLIQSCGTERTYEILSSNDYPQKSLWLFAYFVALPAEAVTLGHLQVLYSLYESAQAEQVVRNFDYLQKFLQLDKAALIRVVQTLVSRAQQEPKFGSPLTGLFNRESEIGQNLGTCFEGNLELLQRAYFASDKADTHHDYDGYFFNQLLDMDPAFSKNWVSWFFTHKKWPSTRDDSRYYSFLWRRPDHMGVMEFIMDSIRANLRDRLSLSGSYLQNFFVMTEGLEDLEEIYARQDAFCDEMIRRHNSDRELMNILFEVISGFGRDRRRGRIITFVQCNQDSAAFEHLPLYSSWWETYGESAVPLLQKRVDFLESLVPEMNTVDLLNHKQRIEHEIQALREDIERQKRREFMRDEG